MDITQRPASPSNYTSWRSSVRVDLVVLHVMEGFARGTGAWFQNPAARVSAHYGIDANGNVEQYVQEADEAWHAGNAAYNRRSIGIELEGHSADAESFTPAMISALVELVRDICARHQIPLDRQHIIGHNEVPDPRPGHEGQVGGADHHQDPGPFFPWSSFMAALVPAVA